MDVDTSWSSPRRSMGLVIILAGLATSTIVLALLYAAAQANVVIMGWYVMPYIPVGAILAGLAAGSGYAVATVLKGVKVTAVMCVAIVVLQLGCYAAAQYLDYRVANPVYQDGTPVGFLTYFDAVTRSFHSESEHGGKPGEPLGVWGYGIRALEMVGFGFGGLIGALIIRTLPYCQVCQQYMKSRKLIEIPSSVPARKIKKKDTEALAAHQAQQQAAHQKAHQTLQTLGALAGEGNHREFQRVLGELAASTKGASKLPRSVVLKMVWCRQCGKGYVRAAATDRARNKVVSSELTRWNVSPEFVGNLREFDLKRTPSGL
jgi:hypothetical protein